MLITGARDFLFVSLASVSLMMRSVIHLFTMFMFNLFNSRSNTSIQESGSDSGKVRFFHVSIHG